MIEIRRLAALDEDARRRLLIRGRLGDRAVARDVAALLADVRARGDAALREQVARFDGVDLAGFEVPGAAWADALSALDPALRRAMEASAAAIRRFHAAQAPRPLVFEAAPGLVLGRRPDPLRRVGVYAPGGRAAYPSSVLMGAVPARVAGVEEVIVCSPAVAPAGEWPDGTNSSRGQSPIVSPLVMAACAVAGVDRLFALGGAGAIGALAFGTQTVPAVDRIVGPGNAYVAEAKMQVAAVVGIDSPAGPSELLVVAEAGADPVTIALEMLAQAEHDPDAAAVLVSTDDALARATAAELARRAPAEPRAAIVAASLAAAGAILVADTLDQALDFATRYAPEHLLLLTGDDRAALDRVRSAGTVFLGSRTSVAFGDYATGANHVLPTGGLARSYSGLSADDFVRWTTWQQADPQAAAALARVVGPFADAEGLPAHAAAARRAGSEGAGRGAALNTAQDRGKSGDGRSAPLPRSPYRSMTAYDPARPALELDLSANTNLWGACPPALAVLREAPPPTGYPTPYADALKRAIAGEWGVEPEQVVTGCGSDDVIDSAIRAFCEPGATVAFPAPTFPMADVFARMNDARPRPVPVAADGTLGEEALAVLVDADVVYLCRPNNPTGAMIPRERVLTLLERARGLVLLDEAYGEYVGESLLAPALEAGNALVLRTLSKAYGLAGLRVGYALGAAPLARAVELSRGPYKVGGLAERAALAAVRDGGAWVRDVVERTVRNRARLAEELERRGLGVLEGAANFVLVTPRPGGPGDPGGPDASAPSSGWAAALKAGLADRGIGVRAFPALDGVGDAIRVTVGPWEVMERFLAALDGAREAVPA